MSKLYAETDSEKSLFSMGAIFVEENRVLDNLSQNLGLDEESEESLNDPALLADEEIRHEINESFFRLDLNLDPYLKADCIGFLEELWDVFDVISAKKVIENLRTQGHRTKFNVLKKHTQSPHQFREIFKFDFEDPTHVQLDDEQFKTLAAWIEKADSFVPKVGILAWDIARYVHLVRLCYVANYVRADEAWAHLDAIQPQVQGQFATWSEFSQSFLIGRTFWAGEEDPELKSACERLLGYTLSPWHLTRP